MYLTNANMTLYYGKYDFTTKNMTLILKYDLTAWLYFIYMT